MITHATNDRQRPKTKEEFAEKDVLDATHDFLNVLKKSVSMSRSEMKEEEEKFASLLLFVMKPIMDKPKYAKISNANDTYAASGTKEDWAKIIHAVYDTFQLGEPAHRLDGEREPAPKYKTLSVIEKSNIPMSIRLDIDTFFALKSRDPAPLNLKDMESNLAYDIAFKVPDNNPKYEKVIKARNTWAASQNDENKAQLVHAVFETFDLGKSMHKLPKKTTTTLLRNKYFVPKVVAQAENG